MARVSIAITNGNTTEDYSSDSGDDFDNNVLPQLFKLFVACLATRSSEMVKLKEDIKLMTESINELVRNYE